MKFFGLKSVPDGQLSSVERPTSAEFRDQVAAKLEKLVKDRLDNGVGFPPVAEEELRRGDTRRFRDEFRKWRKIAGQVPDFTPPLCREFQR